MPTPEPDTRIVIVDDYAEVRYLLGLQLEHAGGVEVVGEAGTVVDAVAVVTNVRPDVVVLDHDLGRRDGVSIIGSLRRLGAEVVVVTGRLTPAVTALATKAGAAAVLDKRDAERRLPGAIAGALARRAA